MFKLSEETCTKVINLGGLDVVLRWCRSCTDCSVLRRCAKALANLALFGGVDNQEIMSTHKVSNVPFHNQIFAQFNILFMGLLVYTKSYVWRSGKTAEKTHSELSRYGLWNANFGPDINIEILTFSNSLFIFVFSPKIFFDKNQL